MKRLRSLRKKRSEHYDVFERLGKYHLGGRRIIARDAKLVFVVGSSITFGVLLYIFLLLRPAWIQVLSIINQLRAPANPYVPIYEERKARGRVIEKQPSKISADTNVYAFS